MIKTLFIGTNWESANILEELFKDKRFEIVGIITQEDKPSGRKQILTPTLVKEFGIKNNIQVFHTNSNEDKYREALELFKPELIVCIAFGEIIPEFVLEYPKYKAINIHFSLLPKYRGAVPIQMAILNGDKQTGITFIKMAKKGDTGPVLRYITEDIKDNDTNQSLRERLVEISKRELPNLLFSWVNGEITPIEQDLSKGSFFMRKDIEKEKAEIKFEEMDSEYIDRMVRAFIPWPVAWCILDGKRVKVYEVKVVDSKIDYCTFKTKNGYIEITKLQPEGRNIMLKEEYLRGRK